MAAALIGFPVIAVVSVATAPTAGANGVAFSHGDVLADIGSGQIAHFNSSGTLLDTLNTSSGTREGDGMCMDSSQNLYATQGFGANTVSKFDSGGNLLASSWGSGYNQDPESCTVDASNNVYVGQPDGSHQVLKFNSSGTLLASYSPAIQDRGTDWLDLASDQHTLYYTSEGSSIMRFDVSSNTQSADFATGLPAPCYELRIRPNGEVMVACTSEVLRLDTSGNVLQTYSIPGTSMLFAMNLDPDGTSFWTADYFTGKIFHVDIATGTILGTITSSLNTLLGGLLIVGGIVVSQPTITLAPPTGSANVGATHTVTATITNPGGSISGQTVNFSVSGVNSASGTGTTNASGQATFTYTGTNAGSDTITGTFTNSHGTTATGTASMTWTSSVCGQPKLDTLKTGYHAYAAGSVTTNGVSTTGSGELLVATVQADGSSTATQTVTSVKGAGLTWTRTSWADLSGAGSSEVWQAYAPTKVTGATVQATFAHPADGSITVMSFTGAAHQLGAVGIGSKVGGPAKATVTPTSSNSLVIAGGLDWSTAAKPVPVAGQSLVTWFLDPTVHDAYWTQSVAAPTTAGTPVTVQAGLPANDRWSLVAVEIPPAC